jgi:lipoprotein NlpD
MNRTRDFLCSRRHQGMSVLRFGGCAVSMAAVLLAGCGTSLNRAPVEDRTAGRGAATAPAGAATPASGEAQGKSLPGIENLGKPGYYAIKPGDTLIRVALENGQSWRDIARWNNIDNPNLLEVGQVLRVLPPGVDASAAAARGVTVAKVDTRPLEAKPASGAASVPVAVPATSAAPTPTPAPTSAPTPSPTPSVAVPAPVVAAAPPAVQMPAPPAAPRDADDDVAWAWPSAATVAAPFDESRNKGLVFTGKAGDPVLAAADGRVVYAGSGLRGFGNLVIVKHNNSYLSVYAHNQTLLVKEDQSVRRGQRIAEMGSSDAERVQLYFEIRRLGKPVDPARQLPQR